MTETDETRMPAQLTEVQRRLLRHVAQGTVDSKSLAALLRAEGYDLGPGTIKTYLYRATKLLGADSRIEAAMRLAAIEARQAGAGASAIAQRQLSGELPGEFTPRPLAPPSKSRLLRLAIAVKHAFTGLPVGGQLHTFSWWVAGLQVVRAAMIGMAGLTAVVLFVFGFLKAFSYPSP